jgi:hypothetical protein
MRRKGGGLTVSSKCPICGEITEDLKELYSAGYFLAGGEFWPFEEEKYCSESCAEKASTFECEKCEKFFSFDEMKHHKHDDEEV